MKIAIDGPAAAGKSTVAKAVAARIGYTYIDTGAMYRAITLIALRNPGYMLDEESLVKELQDVNIVICNDKIFINNEDVSQEIRKQEVTKHVSTIGKMAKVRHSLLHSQQKLASKGCVVMEGRDIGTVVLPDAQVKIFLTATAESRAIRRQNDSKNPELRNIPLSVIVEEIEKRDKIDSRRKIAPLKKAADAIEIDTTHLSIEQIVDKIDSRRKIAPLKKAADAIEIDTTHLSIEQIVDKIVDIAYNILNNNHKGVV